MKAIVLSCDKYRPITNHMILTYQKLWPTNNLKFLVPWNDYYPVAMKEEYGNKIELVNTPVEFKETIFGLLASMEDDEWIYWSTDDTYLINIHEDEANKTQEFVESITDKDIIGVTFGFIRDVPKNINKTDSISYKDLNFIRRTKLTNQWAPQYWRAHVLRYMFDCLEEAPKYKAKQMDYMLSGTNLFWNILDRGKMYTLDHNAAMWGESAHRGNMTKNCVESFKTYGLNIPKTFKKTNTEIYFGNK